MIRIRSAVDSISGKKRYIEVECNSEGLKRTHYFEDGIKKSTYDRIDKSILDSFCDTRNRVETTAEDHQVTLIEEGGDFYFGQEYNKQPQGNGIRLSSTGDITIGKWDRWNEWSVGHYLNIWDSGDIYVGQCYLNANQQKMSRWTRYYTDGTINHYGGNDDAIVAADRQAIGSANFGELESANDEET